MTPASVVLALDGLTKCFGHVVAVDGVDLRLHRGEVLALLGENGAGKTTLMNMLFGHYLPDAGKVRVADGAGLRALPLGDPRAALAAGIGMVHQHFTLALNLSAFDNVVLGTEPMTALRRRRRAGREKLERLMAESGLVVPLDTPLGHLQVGERQRVEILKALYRDVRILILDEPTAVLTPQEADGLFLTLRRLAGAGLGVIFISHKLREVLAFSDRITVLRGGRNVAELATADADGRGLAEIMVGHATDAVARPPATPGDAVLSLRDVSVHGQAGGPGLRGCDLDVRSGEIVGLAGVSGNGQAALAALLSGLRRPTSGVVSLAGAPVTDFDPRAFVAAGVARVPEDRHHDGIVGTMSVAENAVIERLDDARLVTRGFVDRRAIHAEAERLAAAYDVRGPAVTAPARLLSGGNIQKLILARVLDRSPRFILANQPTRGLDVGAAADVARRLVEARDRGAGVLLISEDLDEILGLADRVLVIHGGHVVDAGSTTATDRGTLGLLMAGRAA